MRILVVLEYTDALGQPQKLAFRPFVFHPDYPSGIYYGDLEKNFGYFLRRHEAYGVVLKNVVVAAARL